MSHVYFSLMANKENLDLSTTDTVWKFDNNQFIVPVLHVESDDKEKIREELIKCIDSVLENIKEEKDGI